MILWLRKAQQRLHRNIHTVINKPEYFGVGLLHLVVVVNHNYNFHIFNLKVNIIKLNFL